MQVTDREPRILDRITIQQVKLFADELSVHLYAVSSSSFHSVRASSQTSHNNNIVTAKRRVDVPRHTDVRYCVQLGFIKAAVLSICKNVITQRPRELGCGGGGDEEIQEIHSECLDTEKETPLSRRAQNSGEKKLAFVLQILDPVLFLNTHSRLVQYECSKTCQPVMHSTLIPCFSQALGSKKLAQKMKIRQYCPPPPKTKF